VVDEIVDAIKSSNLTRGAFGGAGKGVPQRTRASRRRDTGQDALPISADERYEPFRDQVMQFWRGQNPGQPDCPWEYLDHRALEVLLKSNKAVTLEIFTGWLVNRAKSENINPSQLPRRWLRNIWEHASGPQDRWGRLKPPPRQW
jgi:hypothetical protein